jgi:hypothetical protein
MKRIFEETFEGEDIGSSWSGIRGLRCVRAGVITGDGEICRR